MDFLDNRSDQVKEVLGKAPSWVVRSGITVVFIIVVLLILGSALISYNDVIPAQIIITSKNPPIYLKANSMGRLTNIFVKANQFVKKEEVLAEIQNTATLKDIIYLKKSLQKSFLPTTTSLDSLKKNFPPFLDLGELQTHYGEFLTQYQNYVLFRILKPYERETGVIEQQLNQERNFLRKQKARSIILKEDLDFSQSAYERNSTLFEKGVISKAEFENASRNFLRDKQQYENFLSSMINIKIAIANFKNNLNRSVIQGDEFENDYRQQLEKSFQNLKSELLSWEQRYLIKSPIDGKVTVFDIWNQYQNVELGETLFTIVPENLEDIIGRVTLPIKNSGKVKVGQKVIIKLANYPFEEWGSLVGTVRNISEVPKQGEESFYTLYIEIKTLTTSYDKDISFKQEMRGSAEIVIEELTILERIFYQLRKLFNST